jgi:hypothetical protein
MPADCQRVITTTSISWLDDAPISKLYEITEDEQLGRSLRPID